MMMQAQLLPYRLDFKLQNTAPIATAMEKAAPRTCMGLPEGVTLQHLSVKYRTVEALQDVSLTVPPGRLVGIFGPNGAGKSTLIKAMLGLIPARGQVLYNKDGNVRPLIDQLDQVAYVPQRSQIDWTYPATVWDVVLMGRTRRTGFFRRFSASSKRIALAALERVGMAELRDRPIGQLSGGQQQRVFLARAIAQEASIFCLDEPFTGIDQKTQDTIFQILRELADAGNVVMVVNHDLGESIHHFDDILLLNRSVVAYGDRTQVLTQENLYQTYGGRVLVAA